jgi:hypothetical protein
MPVTLLLLSIAAAGAAEPRILVVGAHLPGLVGDAPVAAAEALTKAVDASGKADGLGPDESARLIAGRETLILEGFAFGAGRERLKEGRVLFERAQPDQAIPVLADAVKLLEAGQAVVPDTRDLHDAITTLGLAQVGMGEEMAARATFRRSVVLDPSRQLDSVRFSPDVVELFEQIRSQVAGLAKARLTVKPSVDGCRLTIDGRDYTPQLGRAIELVPGDHLVLVRAPGGASAFEKLALPEGGAKEFAPLIQQRHVGVAAGDGPGRARQTRDLYRGFGAYVDDAVILLAGTTQDGQVALQLYSPASNSFSRPVTGEAGADPVGGMTDLVPTLVGYLGENGDIRSDRVSQSAVALDVGANDVLAGMLLDPKEPEPVVIRDRGTPWFLWAGLGALVAGGGGAAAVVLLSGDEPTTTPNDKGVIEFGPIP